MLWLQSFHIISFVCWFAGLFYLPRLFVYHSMTDDLPGQERFKIMERKLYSYITTPTMLATIGFGLWMYLKSPAFYQTQGWMHAKLFLVILLIGFHHVCGKYVRQFEQNANKHSTRFYRWFNEIPVFFLIAIVILAVVKPF